MSAFRPPSGIWPILYAFFGADGALDRAMMRRQVEAAVVGGAGGIAVLGLATEVDKLSPAERRAVVAWAAEDARGRLPLMVTILGDTVAEYAAAIDHAAAHGAACVLLQPPRDRAMHAPGALARFFGGVMERSPLPLGIQNAPEYLGIGLDAVAIAELARRHETFRVLKGEGPATLIERVVARTEGRLAVLNGRGGLELPDNFRAGCAGMVPAPDCFDWQAGAWAALRAGDVAGGERLYRDVLPAIAFVMQSIDHLVCYGKRLTALRLGVAAEAVFDRAPGLAPTPFGLAATARFAAALGGFGAPRPTAP